jgi:hypothetical protein
LFPLVLDWFLIFHISIHLLSVLCGDKPCRSVAKDSLYINLIYLCPGKQKSLLLPGQTAPPPVPNGTSGGETSKGMNWH